MPSTIQWPPVRSDERVNLCAQAAFGLLAMKGKGTGLVQIDSLTISGDVAKQSLTVYDDDMQRRKQTTLQGNNMVLSGQGMAGLPFHDAKGLLCVPQPGPNSWQDRLIKAHNRVAVAP